jgi:hypothetical protein
VLTAVLAGSIPVSLTAIAQAADVPGVRDAIAWVIGIDYTPGKGFARITGPLAHWQVLAGYLMIVLLIAAAVGSRRARRPRAPWLVVAAFLLAWTALLCTETIGVVIAASVACSVLLISPSGVRNKARWSVVAVLITALLGGGTTYARRHTQFAPDPTRPAGQRVVPETLSYRVRIWRKQYLPVVRRNWVTGYGPDLPASITWRYTESIYLRMVMRGGVLLLAVYLALMAQFGVEGARLARREEADAALGACALVLVLTLAVTQVIQPYFTDAGPAQLVWILLGLVAAAQARGARSDQGAGGPVEKSVGRPQRLEAAR